MLGRTFIIAILLAAMPVWAMQSGRINEIGRRHFRPPPSSPGPHTILAPPQLREREIGTAPVAVAPDAVLARETWVVGAARMVTTAPIVLEPPVGITLPAGTIVALRTGDPDQIRCLIVDRPFVVGANSYEDACLLDRDGDGRFETVRLVGKDGPELAIAPVALQSVAGAPDPGLSWFLVQRRVRIARIDGDQAALLVESSIDPGGSGGLGWRALAGPDYLAQLRLRDGEAVRLGGLTFTVHARTGGGWQIAVTGTFAPWVMLRDHDTMVDTGEGTMQAD